MPRRLNSDAQVAQSIDEGDSNSEGESEHLVSLDWYEQLDLESMEVETF